MSIPPTSIELTPCTVNDIGKLGIVSATTFIETFAEYYSAKGFDAFLRKTYAPGALTEETANPGSTFCFVRVDDETAGYAKTSVDEVQSESVMPDILEIE